MSQLFLVRLRTQGLKEREEMWYLVLRKILFYQLSLSLTSEKMSIWLQSRRTAIFCSLILFLCVFLFVTGVTGQQSTMDQQASEVNCNCSKGWFLATVILSVLGASSIILNFELIRRSCRQKPKDDSRTMEEGSSLLAEGELQEKLDHLQEENERLQREKKFLKTQRHKVDVTLDPDTAHPRLELSEDGKSVKDTGTIRNVPRNEKRFDSHTFVLAKEGYTSGRHYWEVDVGKRRSWALGIAQESVTRKGTLTLSPKNGFWVMGCADRREYWAYTESWTRLSVGGKLLKIGIFLDTSTKQLSFYNVRKKVALYTFTIGGESSQKEKFFPFFSTGPATTKPDEEPLKIVWVFDDDDE